MKKIAPAVTTAVTAVSCVLAVSSQSTFAAAKPIRAAVVVWNGAGAGWTNPATSTIRPESTDVHNGSTALRFKFSGAGGWLGAGWNWLGFKKGAYGTDISRMRYLTFWVKSTGNVADLQLNLLSNGKVADTPEHHTDKIHLSTYCPRFSDRTWHLVTIPLKALKQPRGFDARHVCEIQLGIWADHPVDGSYILDGIAFRR